MAAAMATVTKTEEGGNFFSDLFDRVGGNLPKIKIEKTLEQDAP